MIAEDILDGSCCSICTCYFKFNADEGIYVHDYPVVCWDCWDDLNEEERNDYVKADVETF